MAGMNEQDFANLIESIKQAGQIKRGELEPGRRFEVTPLDVKAIRHRLQKSQGEFALMLGVSVSTLQNWEQGRRSPGGPARALLQVAARHPEAVQETLASS
jgi:putative transcriptional regulator